MAHTLSTPPLPPAWVVLSVLITYHLTFMIACSLGCKTCTSNSTCQACQLGYMLANSSCSICPDGTYSLNSSAASCLGGTHLMRIHHLTFMVACSLGAARRAPTASMCQACQPGYMLANGLCNVCPDGTYSFNSTSASCLGGNPSSSNNILSHLHGSLLTWMQDMHQQLYVPGMPARLHAGKQLM